MRTTPRGGDYICAAQQTSLQRTVFPGQQRVTMGQRYKIKRHESCERDGSVLDGTLVQHLGGGPAVEASSIDEAESKLRKQVGLGILERGRVYQICPPAETGESGRTLAVALTGFWTSCQLEDATGFFSEFKRVRNNGAPQLSDYTAKYAPECSSQRRAAVSTFI